MSGDETWLHYFIPGGGGDMLECSLDHLSIPSEIADCTTMMKWMFSFVNCCECKSPIYSTFL